ncbi:MAG TPA: ATP-binding protein [Holophagaceae bacterium]|nr:ATP-binding protein [Holophagaceae bacterium]
MRPSLDRRVQLITLLGLLPAFLLSAVLLARAPGPLWARGAALLAAGAAGLWAARSIRQRVLRPLQTLSNLLAALREGDFSFRATVRDPEDPLGAVFTELNALAELLQQQRLGAMEATALMRTVMGEVDVAVFAFDEADRLRLVNRAGAALLGRPEERLLGAPASELGLGEALGGPVPRLVDLGFPGHGGRWDLRRSAFRQGGHPHQLLMLSDLTRPLREEERQAWQRLVRVLSHEINNSLAPIQSLAGSLADLARREPPPPDQKEDLLRGLEIIAARGAGLKRFLDAYARLAKLPAPQRRPMEVSAWVRRNAALERRCAVEVVDGPEVWIEADGDQLDQLLINLVKNAAEASQDRQGAVRVSWTAQEGRLELRVEDEGAGLPPESNLFVPFFTTKPGGSGIGLALSRQIAEAHQGSLTLRNRAGARGAVATLLLPLGKG